MQSNSKTGLVQLDHHRPIDFEFAMIGLAGDTSNLSTYANHGLSSRDSRIICASLSSPRDR